MLLGTCNCTPSASPISRRGLLCAGGAGFVSALIGTLVGASQTAQAQALRSQVPEVDRLAVRMVTDNQVIRFVPSEKRADIAIERFGPNLTPDVDLAARLFDALRAASFDGVGAGRDEAVAHDLVADIRNRAE